MTATVMTVELARRIEDWVERQEPAARLSYADDPPGGLVVKQRGPEVTELGVKTGRKAWLEVGRYPTLLAFADAHGLADDL